jgi:hypothetical protein
MESVDGITIDCAGPRPRIFYRGDANHPRTRFTISHELGHVLLPWHIGSAECAMPNDNERRDPLEQEADAFAAELLLPSEWLAYLIKASCADMNAVLDAVVAAGASASASMFALAHVLPLGWALQLNNRELVITSDYARQLSRDDANRISSASGFGKINNQTIFWWRLFDVPRFPSVPADKDSAYARLGNASRDYSIVDTPKQIDLRISGMLGHVARVLDPRTAFGYMLWRLSNDAENRMLYRTADFKSWLAWKTALVIG